MVIAIYPVAVSNQWTIWNGMMHVTDELCNNDKIP